MAVRKDSETPEEAQFTVYNGDLEALNRIKEQYHLNDGNDVIIFALGLLDQAGGRPVTVELEDGSRKKLLPADQLKRADQNNARE